MVETNSGSTEAITSIRLGRFTINAFAVNQWSFRGGTRGNAVPIVKYLLERMGTAFRNALERRSHC